MLFFLPHSLTYSDYYSLSIILCYNHFSTNACYCNAFNEMLEGQLLRILNTLGTSFKTRVGVSRNLMSRALTPTPTPVLKFYRCEHSNFTE